VRRLEAVWAAVGVGGIGAAGADRGVLAAAEAVLLTAASRAALI